jgi:N,N'-diacetyllegionaminate synthase
MTNIIAEIAQAHEGSLGIAHSYIDALADCGVDVIKFQTHIANAESSEFEKFRVNFSYEDVSRFDYWKRMEFTIEEWAGLKKHCEDKGIEFLSSPFSIEAVNLLEKIGVSRYKIGSGEIQNLLMLDRIGKTGKPIILSSGMSNWVELDESIHFLRSYKNPISLLQCTTAYPTTPEQWGLSVIKEMKERYNVPIGFSDHSADIFACLAATALGAEIVEFHVVFDHKMFGPDAKASLNLSQTHELVKGIRQINVALATPVLKEGNEKYDELKILFGKSLSVNKNVRAGELVLLEDLETKKPGNIGIPANKFSEIIGKKWKRNLLSNSFITINDIE